MSHDLTLFLGRFHPVLVHLPIGFIVLLAALEILALVPRFKGVNSHNQLIAALTIPTSLFSAGCGWLLSRDGGYDPALLNWHMWAGFALAALCAVTYLLLRLEFQRVYRVFLGATCALLLVASHYGGSLTHGKDYLTRYAPQPIPSLLGTKAPPAPVQTAAQPKPAVAETPDPLNQPVFATVVQPLLKQYCVSCHGPEKAKENLRLDTFAFISKGSEHGPVLVPGKPLESSLIKHMLLPLSSDEHMPPEGKPQPTADELALLQWWVESGAPEHKTLAELNPPEKLRAWLIVKTGAPPQPPALVAPKPREEVLPVAEQLAEEMDISITSLAASEPWFQANASLASAKFGDAQLARLAPLAANLRWLDLAGTSVTDDAMVHVSKMPHLTRLHLERTKITDRAFAHLAGLKHLEYLNFHGTETTDAALEHLQNLPKLRQVYLWNTKVTPTGAKKLQAALTDSAEIRTWQTEIEQLSARIRNATASVEIGTSTNLAALALKPVNTICPVSGKPIDASFTSLYGSNLVAFCCTNCRANFLKDPKPFLAKLNLPAKSPESTSPAVIVEKVSTTAK